MKAYSKKFQSLVSKVNKQLQKEKASFAPEIDCLNACPFGFTLILNREAMMGTTYDAALTVKKSFQNWAAKKGLLTMEQMAPEYLGFEYSA